MVNSGDTAFVLISAALVAIMTPGVALFYGGLVHHRSVVATMMQSFVSMGLITVLWFVAGFSLAFGTDNGGIIGNLDWAFLRGVGMQPNPAYGATIPFIGFFAYQEMFAIITPALITGAFADRMTFRSYLVFLGIWGMLVYVPLAHWMWGGGFLAQLGSIDFAGGNVVHISSGFAALASVFVLGSRIVKSPEDSYANGNTNGHTNGNGGPHSMPLVAIGAALLWFGWFGFNGGSALAANGLAATAFVNTDIAASVAMVTWLIISWVHKGKPSMVGALTGAVAGLVAITPAAGYVEPWAALIIGFAVAFVCYGAILFREKMKWDDALDVWGVHGAGGVFGGIATGLFASPLVNGKAGLVYGDAGQFLAQLAAVSISAAFAFGMTYTILKVMSFVTEVRVLPEVELKGLDICQIGEPAYDIAQRSPR